MLNYKGYHGKVEFDEEAGMIYVFLGGAEPFPFTYDLNMLDGSNGFIIGGATQADRIGSSVSTGDINGDGYDDIVIGARNADPNGVVSAGETYVIFGKSGDFDMALSTADLDAAKGFTIRGINEFDASGNKVATADLNGDGFDDVILSAFGVDQDDNIDTGAVYAVLGKAEGFSDIGLSQLNGSNGFTVLGIKEDDKISSVHGGDLDGDGMDDLIIGAQIADPDNISMAGEVYVVPGRSSGFPAVIELADAGQENISVFMGVIQGSVAGASVSSGDVNGDETEDLIVGAPFAGSTYIIYGSSQGMPDTLKADELNGSNGFTIEGDEPGFQSGFFVSASDIDIDGIDDIIIGEPFSGQAGNSSGTSYVIFGAAAGTFSATVNLATAAEENGITVFGRSSNDGSGVVITSGDVDGDGNPDLMIGAPDADPDDKTSAGEVYVLLNTDKYLVNTEEDHFIPGTISLRQNYPNPFNPVTTIPFSLSAPYSVTLEVYDLLGQRVAILLNGDFRTAGNHNIPFHAGGLASGLYVYQLVVGGQIHKKQLTLIK